MQHMVILRQRLYISAQMQKSHLWDLLQQRCLRRPVWTVVWKTAGVLFAVWLTEKTGLGKRSRTMTWRTVAGLGFLASIGFTMSMFVTMLAFNGADHLVQAKIGIFAASLLGGAIGYLLLSRPQEKG